MIFFLFAGFFIISQNNLNIGDDQDRDVFLEKYGSWINSLIDNFGSVTGYVVKMEWLPQEQ